MIEETPGKMCKYVLSGILTEKAYLQDDDQVFEVPQGAKNHQQFSEYKMNNDRRILISAKKALIITHHL